MIRVLNSVKKGVSLEETKFNLVALYVFLSSVPTMAPVDFVVSLPLRKSPIEPYAMVLPSVNRRSSS